MPVRDLVDTTEMYLRTIYELEEEGIRPLRARIAERLEQSGPTVSQTVARMERDELLTIESDRSLKLSPHGRNLAIAVMRKHRLAERLLTDVIGLPWDKVHDEACRWEHVMGEEVESRLVSVLKEHTTSPFGNPIPGLEAIADEHGEAPHATSVQRAADLDLTTPTQVKLVSINEIVQVEGDIMSQLSALRIVPGQQITLSAEDGCLTLANEKGQVRIPEDLGHALRVETL